MDKEFTGIEKLKHIGYMFSYSGIYPEIEDNEQYGKMAEKRIEFDREIEDLSTPPIFNPNLMSTFLKWFNVNDSIRALLQKSQYLFIIK